ncbi:50S ribosomal protein L9 [Parvibaculum sp.]|jgi:large subunit ribosomal protein L9|uniref:50S ribosomal protein L9 n=1 Tax=Parvibaculum sp. TaxID=2024848 RepID=UPI000C471E68|nr:50S ribosomal protein L9 [Parvibaculum sp.]MAU60533.1 50S ribosomal protein L9 [Parvibaculum sp.]MBO6667414.1 50S ribosomal protein L9 [Parvibaculum sp.]MBO6692376.1 50S ribosomal protein L9 [Parvibaculum sp.]MBO6713966.1 50S ribosomal protein L9 [Parvibaculum sp.]|tara:strand:+ start:3361 stop:3963 length:603 start_codon:yes stop_codon:yes gene_type:complete
MQVVLLERVEKLGQMGDVVKVKDGFARNFLLPRKKALRATKANLEQFEKQRAQLEARNLELKKEAEQVHAKVNGQAFIVLRQAGETGILYGSVSTRDIADAMTNGGFSTARNQVVLDKPIKTIGLHEIRIVLHPEVSATISINVARTEEEAQRQAAGEDLTQTREEREDEEQEAAEFFENEELAPQDGEESSEDEGETQA